MPKAKSNQAMRKRVATTGSGKLKTAKTAKRHLLQNKSKSAKGRNKYGAVMNDADTKKVKRALKI